MKPPSFGHTMGALIIGTVLCGPTLIGWRALAADARRRALAVARWLGRPLRIASRHTGRHCDRLHMTPAPDSRGAAQESRPGDPPRYQHGVVRAGAATAATLRHPIASLHLWLHWWDWPIVQAWWFRQYRRADRKAFAAECEAIRAPREGESATRWLARTGRLATATPAPGAAPAQARTPTLPNMLPAPVLPLPGQAQDPAAAAPSAPEGAAPPIPPPARSAPSPVTPGEGATPLSAPMPPTAGHGQRWEDITEQPHAGHIASGGRCVARHDGVIAVGRGGPRPVPLAALIMTTEDAAIPDARGGNWKETRPFEQVQDPGPVVRDWYRAHERQRNAAAGVSAA